MKKIILFSIVALFFSVFTAQRADAQNCSSRVISRCNVCNQNVFAYYRPINYGGVVRYAWVPAYHTACAARASQTRYVTKYHRGVPYRYPVTNSRSRGHSRGYSGYVRPGLSITIRR